MAIDKEMRKRIDNLLAVYLNHLERHEAGWHSENDLQRLADYKGDLPPPSGFDRSNAFMIGALGMTRQQHAQLVKIEYLLGKPVRCQDCGKGDAARCASCSGLGVRLVKGVVKNEYAMVLLAERYWARDTASVVSARLGLSDRQYVQRLMRAREAMAQEIETIDRIRQMVLEAEGLRGVSA
jgi:hypothetical protein